MDHVFDWKDQLYPNYKLDDEIIQENIKNIMFENRDGRKFLSHIAKKIKIYVK